LILSFSPFSATAQIILLGDGAVGKTSIANRFTEDKFAQSYKQTVGVDFFVRRLQLSRQNNPPLPSLSFR
jgi:GTPase SAR1 family protein